MAQVSNGGVFCICLPHGTHTLQACVTTLFGALYEVVMSVQWSIGPWDPCQQQSKGYHGILILLFSKLSFFFNLHFSGEALS